MARLWELIRTVVVPKVGIHSIPSEKVGSGVIVWSE